MSIPFQKKYLWSPLGIKQATWALKYRNGVDVNSLRMIPREMAKVGLTFLNNGVWNGERIVSEAWVKQSSRPYPGNSGIKIPGADSGKLGYAYAWWTKTFIVDGKEIEMFFASGWGGQHIMVIPAYQTVIVFTGCNYVTFRPAFEIMENYILPALNTNG